MKQISQSAYEIAIGSLQAQGKRLFILCIALLIALIATNGAWIWHEAQYEDVSVTQEATADNGSDLVINGTGDINYGGESETDGQNTP